MQRIKSEQVNINGIIGRIRRIGKYKKAPQFVCCSIIPFFVFLFSQKIIRIDSPESLSVLNTHHIVKQRIQCRRKIVEATGEVEENLVDGSEHLQVLEVDISKSLDVERRPRHEEKNNNGNYNKKFSLLDNCYPQAY